MKKILFVLLAICTFHFANAQEFHFMPRIGVNFANLSNSGGYNRLRYNVSRMFHHWGILNEEAEKVSYVSTIA